MVKDENGDLLAYYHSMLNRCKNYVHGVNNVRQTKIWTAEPLIPEPRYFKVEIAIEKLRCKFPTTIPFPAELIQAGS